MPILILLLATGLLLLLQRKIYEKYWSKGLDVQIDLGKDRYIFEGDQIRMEETLSNNKILPLPWVYVKYQLSVNGSPRIYGSDMFSISFRQRIRRKKTYTLPERGIYTLGSVDLVSHDLFLMKTLSKVMNDNPGSVTVYPRLVDREAWPVSYENQMGDIVTKRYFPEDPYIFKGIREYQETDSFRKINFKASARSGEWMVNVYETTVSQRVTLLLGMDKGSQYYDTTLYEYALRMAGTVAVHYENSGIPVGLYSNGTDALLKKETRVQAGCGTEHIYEILEALARMNIEKEAGSIIEEIDRCAAEEADDTVYILITPCYTKEITEAYQRLCEKKPTCRWLLPQTTSQAKDTEFAPNHWEETVPGFSLWEL